MNAMSQQLPFIIRLESRQPYYKWGSVMRCMWVWMLGAVVVMNIYGQTPKEQDFSIKVGVEEVRIDATALDRKGRQVPDLTAGDFEIYQDGKLQKITACIYMADSKMPVKKNLSPEAAKAELLVSKPLLHHDEVRRTIAFLFNGTYEARMALQRFVERQMKPGDMAAIIGAGAGTGASQRFSSDRRELLSRINKLPFRIDMRDSPGSFLTCEQITEAENIRQLKAQLAPIRYGIQALRDMPGRKYLISMSQSLLYRADAGWASLERLFNETANEAWRAGVVISTMDTKGLSISKNIRLCEKELPIARKTGGLFIENNAFVDGLGEVEQAMRGYYLLSYVPAKASLDDKRREAYHHIKVKSKRSGIEIYSRDGFFDSASSSQFASAQNTITLQNAIFSPFLYNNLNLSISAGYAYTASSGYFIQSWMHLDSKDLTFTKEKNGDYSLALQLTALTSDSSGRIQDSKGFRYDFQLNDAEVSRIRRDGIDLTSYLPVKTSGDYYVRAAVKDIPSGKIGSGYQFLEVPDLSQRRLSLSSIFILNVGETISDLAHIRGSSEGLQKWQALRRSRAIRIFSPGESLHYATYVYNARRKNAQPPELSFQFTLFKNGQIFFQSKAETIDIRGVEDLEKIPIVRDLPVDEAMAPGDYLLQITVFDKNSSGKYSASVQAIDFHISSPSPEESEIGSI